MAFASGDPPWYASGLAFECARCGRCCAGPEEGNVWVATEEVAAIAQRLCASPDDLMRRYIRRVGGRFSLVEKPGNRDCVFLSEPDGPGGQRGCAIYPVRPTQCRTWPFWPMNLAAPEDWAEAGKRCPGINRGKLHTPDEIQTRCNATK